MIAAELGAPIKATAGPVIERAGDLAALLTALEHREMLFVDEIHRLDAKVEEILYPALEDYSLDLMIGTGPGARSMKIPLKPFTLVGATTRAGLLTAPLRGRFGIVHRLDFYTEADLEFIVTRSARILGVPIDAGGRARDRAPQPRHAAHREPPAAPRARLRPGARRRAPSPPPWPRDALRLLEVDEHGFDEVDRKLLLTIIDKFGGGPVGRRRARRRHQRRAGRHRGHLRAVPAPDRLPRPHAARPRRPRAAPTSTSAACLPTAAPAAEEAVLSRRRRRLPERA